MKHQKTIEQDVINFIKNYNLLTPDAKVLVGLSGGSDSVFVLNFLRKYAQKFKVNLAACHINHKLRGSESIRDEKFCENLCKMWNIEYYSSVVNVDAYAKRHKESVEEAARHLRYNEFARLAKISKSDLIVTAHNNDDNTETVLLNIVSGSGLTGISGIPIKRDNIIRPILCLSKESIINYLNHEKINFVEDSSNKNLEYKRNFLRNEIIPQLKKHINPSIDKSVLNSSKVFRNQNIILNYFVDKIIGDVYRIEENKSSLKLSALKEYPKEILGEVFKKILEYSLGLEYNFAQYEKLKSLFNSQVGIQINLGKGNYALRERNKIVFFSKSDKPAVSINIKIGEKVKVFDKEFSSRYLKIMPRNFKNNRNIEYISGDQITKNLKLRNWKFGDKIQLLGMKGTKKVSDVLTDLKISSICRKNQLVLANNNDIIWICGHRINENYKVTKQTTKIVKLCLS